MKKPRKKLTTHFEVSLRPYPGVLYVAPDAKIYERAHKKIFNEPDPLNVSQAGRFSGGKGPDGMWTYLIWAPRPDILAHELSHVILHLFERLNIDPREARGEPFCYLISQLIEDVNNKMK